LEFSCQTRSFFWHVINSLVHLKTIMQMMKPSLKFLIESIISNHPIYLYLVVALPPIKSLFFCASATELLCLNNPVWKTQGFQLGGAN
jgi:hypothetical protein